MWSYCGDRVRDWNCALMNLLVDVHHDCVRLRGVGSRVQQAWGDAGGVEGARLLHTRLLSIREVVVVLVLAD